jgi:anti-sigma factor RsiW
VEGGEVCDMNCEKYWNESAGAEPEEDFDAHLAACPWCAARWAAGDPVAAGLRLLAAEMKNVSAPPRVEANLLRAYRERYRRPVPPAREFRQWWAAAATVLLVASALWTGLRPPPARLVAASSRVLPAAAIEEEDTAFVPLPNAAGSPQDDDVDLVRVELPRSAVTALGMPAGDDSEAESVEAEVLVGPDGMARAVRFLN